HGEHQVGLAGEFTIDRRGAGTGSDTSPHGSHLNIQAQSITRFHLPLEANTIDSGKEANLALVLATAGQNDAAQLGKCLDNQHTGHDGEFGKVPFEEMLVGGNVLDANATDTGFEF